MLEVIAYVIAVYLGMCVLIVLFDRLLRGVAFWQLGSCLWGSPAGYLLS